MPRLPIEQLEVGRKDSAGNTIICMYAKKPPIYAVYREPMKVVVHFAEDPRKEARQRTAIAALNPLRGQISGLIDGWRSSRDELKRLEREHEDASFLGRTWAALNGPRLRRNRSRAERYDRRVADAMVMGLEGGVPGAIALLTEIRDQVKAERESIAETDYLLWAAIAGILALFVVWFISATHLIPNPPDNSHLIWTGAAAGVLGAFFSIATGLRNRAILIDLQKWDNRRDAILRIAVGTIGAGIILCLIMAKLITITGITDNLTAKSTALAAVVGFLAGFSERAVGNLLATATGSLAADKKVDDVAVAQAKAAVQPGAAAGAETAVGLFVPDEDQDEDLVAAADHPEIEVDACLCDSPPLESEVLTKDEDLPVSVGGVSLDAPPPVLDQPPVAGPVEQVRDIIEKGAAAPGADEPDGEPTGPKADTPAE